MIPSYQKRSNIDGEDLNEEDDEHGVPQVVWCLLMKMMTMLTSIMIMMIMVMEMMVMVMMITTMMNMG